MVPASRKLGKKEAGELAKAASKVIVAKGKKVSEFAGGKASAEVVEAMLGPTGNLRAPTIRRGKTIIVGYNDEVFEKPDYPPREVAAVVTSGQMMGATLVDDEDVVHRSVQEGAVVAHQQDGSGEPGQGGFELLDRLDADVDAIGEVLIGGTKKFSSRVTPPWMLEEGCHRNFAFTMFHADEMPMVEWGLLQVRERPSGLWEVTVEVRNPKLIPSILSIARQKKIGARDIILCHTEQGGRVVASGTVTDFSFERKSPLDIVATCVVGASR